jgi:protein TonB
VKRFLLAAALAVALHGFVLAMTPGWLTKTIPPKIKPRIVTLSLSYYQPKTETAKPILRQAEIQHTETVPVIKKQEQVATAKPRPPKKVLKRPKTTRRALEPKKEKHLPKAAPALAYTTVPPPQAETPPEIPENLSPARASISKDVLEDAIPEEGIEVASVPPAHPLREARPMYLKNPRPHYPRLARRRAYQGTVVLEVLVDQYGNVSDLRVWKSSGYQILDSSAMNAVRSWLFEPGMRGNEKVAMWVRIPVRFQLE